MADQPKSLKPYAVSLRCESTTFPHAGATIELPIQETDDAGKFQFFIFNEYGWANGGVQLPKYLLLRTVMRAEDLQDATDRANKKALQHLSFISFLMNAYVGPSIPWTTYEMEPINSWRVARQGEWERTPSPALRRIRPLDENLILRFYGSPRKVYDMSQLQRSMDLYGVALKHWNVFDLVLAAHYLFIAAEGLTEMAVPIYLKKQGKTEEALIEVMITEILPNYLPKGLKKEEGQAMRADWKKRGYPGKLIDQAKSIIKSRARKDVIFDGFADAYVSLNKATNGLEHGGGDHNEFRTKEFVAQLEKAAVCVRSWILRQLIADEALLAELTSEPYKLPMANLEAVVNVDGEFKCDQSHIPLLPTSGSALYETTIQAEGIAQGKPPTVSAKPLFKSEVETRNVNAQIFLQPPTLSEQFELLSASMKQVLGADVG